jgi:hypothetical protein
MSSLHTLHKVFPLELANVSYFIFSGFIFLKLFAVFAKWLVPNLQEYWISEIGILPGFRVLLFGRGGGQFIGELIPGVSFKVIMRFL